MRLLIQRVRRASVTIGGAQHASIGAGLLLFVGVEEADTQEDIDYLAGKAARLRIFGDEAGEGFARPMYERFVAALAAASGRPVRTGVFGADMAVELLNDGPVTIWIDSRNKE